MIFGEYKPTSVGDGWNTIELGLGWPKPTFAPVLRLYPNLSRYLNDRGIFFQHLEIKGFTYVISIIQFLKRKREIKCSFKICAVRYTTVCNSRVAYPADSARKRYFVMASFANLLLRGKLYAILVKV